MLERFAEAASRFARNPLGIIALFIVLVYGIAALALGTGAASLSASDKSLLVWFLVLFPVLVLVSFVWLVVQHQAKLYGPADFQDDESFLETLSPARQGQRLQAKVDDIVSHETAAPLGLKSGVEVPAGGEPESEPDLREKVLLAQELAFRAVEYERGSPISRQAAQGAKIGVDGIFVLHGAAYGVDVQYLRTLPIDVAGLRSHLGAIAGQVSRLRWRRFSLLVVFVLDGVSVTQAQSAIDDLKQFAKTLNLQVQFEGYDLSELRRWYGVL